MQSRGVRQESRKCRHVPRMYERMHAQSLGDSHASGLDHAHLLMCSCACGMICGMSAHRRWMECRMKCTWLRKCVTALIPMLTSARSRCSSCALGTEVSALAEMETA